MADDQRTIGSGELLPHLARGIAGWLVAALVASLALPEHQQAPAAWIAALAICLLTLRAIRADRTRAAAEGSAPSGRGPASS